MKWIFVSLIFMNVMYFSWQQWQVYDSTNREKKAPIVESTIDRAPVIKKLIEQQENNDDVKGRLCQVAGPYSMLENAEKIKELILGGGESTKVIKKPISNEKQSWVIIPPSVDRREALHKLRDIQSRGIDSFLITQGPLQNAISIGSFENQHLATVNQDRLKQAGYVTTIEKFTDSREAFWVQVEMPLASDVHFINNLNDSEGQAVIKFTQTLCE